MKLLELFSGTGSVGKVAKEFGFDVVSLDLKNADINCNILEWDYKQYPVGYFGFIHASPPCTEYSRAKTVGIRKIDEANAIVQKTLEIIDYFKPKIFVIENPQTGLLKNQWFMQNLCYFDIDYCKYGFNYRKRTRLWSNLKNWTPRPLCKRDCGKVVNNKHIETAQRLPSKTKAEWGDNPTFHSQSDLYRIPADLLSEIFRAMGLTENVI